jgi:glutathione synthase/RimK-type ligase-like ATP-grasp enzyme
VKQTKNIVVIYKSDDWYKELPMKSIETRKSFENWHERGLLYGVAMYRASIEWYDLEKNVFVKAWAFRDGKWQKVTGPIKPDLIYDKIMSKRDYELFNWKMAVLKNVKVYNDPLFRVIVDNKLSQYLMFNEQMVNSYVAYDKKDLLFCIKKIKSKKIVLKPLYGSGGFGIIICDKKEISRKKISYPVFLQEFIETDGIPGVSKKGDIADLRLVFVNHKLMYSLSRVAKKGSLFTNFHQGAEAILVNKKDIPRSVLEMTKIIHEKLMVFPAANYSLDYMFDKQERPYLVEMNSTPGFDLLEIVGDEIIKKRYFEEFIKVIE